MRVLVVKMSSLGDVVHTLPGVSDAVLAHGAGTVSFDWVVEEAFADIPARHTAVAGVIPVAWRRWRHRLAGSAGEMRRFVSRLRRERYDVVLDAQGLIKSAAVTALARGAVRAGLSRRSAREGAAAVVYGRRLAVPRHAHAVDRIRTLFAEALDYQRPSGPPDYGITGRRPVEDRGSMAPRCVLLHGTTWESKHWPLEFWQALARRAAAAGFEVRLPWGDEAERRRAAEIAAAAPAMVLDRLPLGRVADELAGAALVVGVDSGLSHLAAALEVPTVVVYGSTSSALTGCRGSRVRNLQAQFPCSPCLSRVCTYRGPAQRVDGQAVEPACYATLTPATVWQAAEDLISGSRNADRLLHF